MVFKISFINLTAKCLYRKVDLVNWKPSFKKKVKCPENLDKYVVVHAHDCYEHPLYPLEETAHTPHLSDHLCSS